MNVFREVYDFITGGSIAAPIGLAVAIVVAITTRDLGGAAPAAIFFTLILITLAAASLEKVA